MFSLNFADVFRGLAVAILTGAFLAVSGVFGSGFDVFTADWASIGKSMINGGFAAFVGYILKNFLTADNGKILKVL